MNSLYHSLLLLSNGAGLPRRLRATNLLWKGKTQSALNLLQDDVLVADPGTKCVLLCAVDFKVDICSCEMQNLLTK